MKRKRRGGSFSDTVSMLSSGAIETDTSYVHTLFTHTYSMLRILLVP